jgi:hypothetical protein
MGVNHGHERQDGQFLLDVIAQLRADFSAKDEELAILKHQDLYKLLIDAQKRLEKAKKVIQPLAEYFDNDTSFGWMVPLAKAWLAEVKK